MKQHLIKILLLALFILPTVSKAQQQSDQNQVSIRAFYSSYAVIYQSPNFDDFYKKYSALLDKYASSSFKQSILSGLDDPNIPPLDIATDDNGIQAQYLGNLKVEKRGAYYLVRYPIYDSDEKKYIEIGLKITLDSHGKIQSVSGSYTKEIKAPTDLNK